MKASVDESFWNFTPASLARGPCGTTPGVGMLCAMELSDTDRIRNLLGRYCEYIDAGDFTGVGRLFADGALMDLEGQELARGADAVSAFYAESVRRHSDGTPRTKHLVLDTVIEVPWDDGTVTARSSYTVLQETLGLALQPIIAGRYVDRFAPGGPEGWHFVERRFGIDLVGDLSNHLLIDPGR